MKVSIIGGGGRVGSCAAYALECAGIVSEIQIIDANQEAAEGEAHTEEDFESLHFLQPDTMRTEEMPCGR